MDELKGKNCATCVRATTPYPNDKCRRCIETSTKDNKFPEWEAKDE